MLKNVKNIFTKFKEEIKRIEKGDPKAMARAEKIAESVRSQIDAKPNGGVIFMGDPDWKNNKHE